MKRVTGIGGVFFKSKDVAALKAWYQKHLGFVTTDWGASMMWGLPDTSTPAFARTEWSPFAMDTKYLAPSSHPYMFNYRVHDVTALVEVLKSEGVEVLGDVEKTDYGNFAWIMDPDGRKVELWQPVDEGFGDAPPAWTERVTGLGGVFFKCSDPQATKEWYKRHLDVSGLFHWLDLQNPQTPVPAMTVWSPFPQDTDYFAPSDKPWMFNYRVNDLKSLVETLRSEGVVIAGEIQDYPYGRFAWILDPEGTKVELWEALDQ